MSKKSYELIFEKPPKPERKRKGKPEYSNTIDSFIASEQPYAKIEVPTGEKVSNVQIGLKHSILRKGKANEIKIVKRKGSLYLITRSYSDKEKWTWRPKPRKK